MLSKLNELLQRLGHPHPVVEYILAGVVLASTAISLNGGPLSVTASTTSRLITEYPLLPGVFVLMSIVALAHLAFLSVYPPTNTSMKWRARALSVYAFGFMFVFALALGSFGTQNLLWINELAISLIASVLYLNLRVNYVHAGK